MKKYRKKPVTIEAIQLDKYNIREVYELVNDTKVNTDTIMASDKWEDFVLSTIANGLNVPTLEDGKDKRAKHVADIGDWIIKGVKGELYPCKPDIFDMLYDKE